MVIYKVVADLFESTGTHPSEVRAPALQAPRMHISPAGPSYHFSMLAAGVACNRAASYTCAAQHRMDDSRHCFGVAGLVFSARPDSCAHAHACADRHRGCQLLLLRAHAQHGGLPGQQVRHAQGGADIPTGRHGLLLVAGLRRHGQAPAQGAAAAASLAHASLLGRRL